MLGKTSVGDSLTPKIKLNYSDFSRIEAGSENTVGYFTFQARSLINQEIHHIRAFNLSSHSVQQDKNQATTIFLQETLRLCSLQPDILILNSFEFYNNKICYAMKPITSPVSPSTPNLNISSILKGLLEDLKHLSHYGEIQIPTSNIYKINEELPISTKKNNEANGDDRRSHSLLYFVQDWNQVMSSTAIVIAGDS